MSSIKENYSVGPTEIKDSGGIKRKDLNFKVTWWEWAEKDIKLIGQDDDKQGII